MRIDSDIFSGFFFPISDEHPLHFHTEVLPSTDEGTGLFHWAMQLGLIQFYLLS